MTNFFPESVASSYAHHINKMHTKKNIVLYWYFNIDEKNVIHIFNFMLFIWFYTKIPSLFSIHTHTHTHTYHDFSYNIHSVINIIFFFYFIHNMWQLHSMSITHCDVVVGCLLQLILFHFYSHILQIIVAFC